MDGHSSDPSLLRLTKIVSTIGPVSEAKEVTSELVEEGMAVMRINFSHATYDEAAMRVNNVGAIE